jgi:twitching motility two-component system response regulator PilG
MLTGKDGFIDRVRARIVGATDYLTKPLKIKNC